MDDRPARPPSREGRTLLVLALVVVLALVAAWLAWDSEGPPGERQATTTESAAASSSAASVPPRQPRRSERARPPEATATDNPSRASADAAAVEPTHAIRCVVVAAADGNPVEGAEVLFVASDAVFDRGPHRATTGADGTAVVHVPDDLVWRAVARKDGLHTARREHVPRATEVRFEMKPAIRVEGRVIDADTRAPVAGVLVRAWGGNATTGASEEVGTERRTGADGRFAIEDAPDGQRFRIFAVRPGIRTADVYVTRSGPGPEVELVLGEGGILEGTVFDAKGRPAAGVSVFQLSVGMDIPDPAWAQDESSAGVKMILGFIFPPVKTGADGHYEFRGARLPIDGVPQPRFAAARDAEGREAWSESAALTRHGERMTRDIRFLAQPRLTVRLTSAAPITDGWRIRVVRNGGDPEITRDLRPGESSADFGELRPGRFEVSAEPGASADGAAWRITRSLELVPGDPQEVALPIDLPGTVSGVLVDDDGAPAPGIRVGFLSEDDATATGIGVATKSGADGRFVIARLLPHPGRLTVAPHERQNDSLRGKGTRSWSEVTLDDVVPGGPPLRIVLRRRCRVTGRSRPVPRGLELQGSAMTDASVVATSARTDDDGRFSFEPPFAGDGVLLVFAQDGFAPLVIEGRRLPSGGDLDLGDLVFTKGAGFETRFVDTGRKPLARAEVWMTDPWFDRSVAVDGEGRARFEHLPDRPLHLTIGATRNSIDWRITIDPRSPPAEIVVGIGVEVRGRISETDHLLPHHIYRALFVPAVVDRGVGLRAAETRISPDGSFAIRLQPGRWKGSVADGTADPVVFEVGEEPVTGLELRKDAP